MITNKIICGAMPEATKVFPDGYFNCSISSPPYWALRDYGVAGQLGLEPTFEEYIDKLCTIYDEVKRVLRDDGTCWVNLGDSYGGSSKGQGGNYELSKKQRSNPGSYHGTPLKTKGLEKSLCLIPQRFAIEMVNRGWILRNVIIWKKPNPMPSSAKDRFTVDFEYVYFFVKSKKYWFEPQYEPYECAKPESISYRKSGKSDSRKDRPSNIMPAFGDDGFWKPDNPLGRNKRTVWTIPTQPYPEAHFATFPEKLVEPMIRSGCPEFVCTKCGKAREKVWDTSYVSQGQIAETDKARLNGQGNNFATRQQGRASAEHHFKGYTDCGCNADWRPGIVLDCFCWQWYDFTGSCKAAA